MVGRNPHSARRRLAGAAAHACEKLESRRLLSTIAWLNEGTLTNDSDGFNACFGTNATAARNTVQAAITTWENIITNFNRPDHTNGYLLSISMASTGTGFGASENTTNYDGNLPESATITILRGNSSTGGANGDGTNWLLDNTVGPSDNFAGTISNPWSAAASTTTASADGDLYMVMLHEISHAMGFVASTQVDALSHKTSTVDTIDSSIGGVSPAVGFYYVFSGADISCLLTSYNSDAGGGVDNGNPLHFAPAGASATYNGTTYTGADDLMTPYFTLGQRKLISDADALVLKDAYGYSINLPDTLPTFDDWLDPTNGELHVAIGSGANGQAGSFSVTNAGATYSVGIGINGFNASQGGNGILSASFTTSQISSVLAQLRQNDQGMLTSPSPSIPITVDGDGTFNDESLTLELPDTNNSVAVTDNSGRDTTGNIAGAATVQFDALDGLSIDSTGGNDTINIEGLPVALSSFNFFGGASGTNTLQIDPADGILADEFLGFTHGAAGGSIFFGGDGSTNNLTLVDSSDTGTWDTFFYNGQFIIGNGNVSLNVDYADVQSLTVDGNGGADGYGIYIVPSGQSLTINGGNGGNSYYVGNVLKNTLVGNVHLNGGSGDDEVTLDDTGATTAQDYLLGFGFIQDGGSVFLGTSINGVELEGSNTASTYDISDTVVPTTLLGGNGADTFNVGKGLISGIFSPLSMNGGAGSNKIFIDDTLDTAGTTDVIGAGTFSGGLAGFTWSNVASVQFDSGPKQDNIYVTGTAAGTPLQVDDGNFSAPPDNVYVSSDTTLADGVLSGLHSLLTLSSSFNGAAVQISEAGETADDSITVNENSGALSSSTLGWSIHLAGVANTGGVTLTGGQGDDVINVQSTFTGESYTVDGGGGANAVNVTLPQIAGPLTVDGTGSDTLTLNDTTNAAASNAWSVSPTAVSRVPSSGATRSVTYVGVGLVSLLAAGGADSFNIGAGQANAIAADIAVNGGAGSNSLVIDDSADPTGQTQTIGAGTFAGPTLTASWTNVASVRLKSGLGQDTIYVTGTGPSVPLEVDDGNTGGASPDSIFVSSDPTLADGVLTGLQSPLTLRSAGNGAAVQVSESGETADDSVVVNEASGLLYSTALGWSINFPGNANGGGISFVGGQGNDSIDVVSTYVGESYAVDGGGGANTVEVNSPAIEGPLTVTGNGDDTLNISDAPDAATSNTWTITSSSVTRVPSSGYTMQLNYSGLSQMNLIGSQQSDDIDVLGTAAGTPVFLNGGAMTTTYNIGGEGAGDTTQIQSEVVVASPADGQTAALNINDGADTRNVTYHIDSVTVGDAPGDNLFAPGGYVYFSPVSSLSVTTGSGQDNAWILPSGVTPIFVEGNAPTTAPGDTLHLSLDTALNPVFTPGGSEGSGSYTYDNGPGVSFDGFENVDASSTAPLATSAQFTLLRGRDALELSFTEPIYLSTQAITLINQTTSAEIDPADMALSGIGTNTIYVTFPGLTGGDLPSAIYDLTLSASLVTDISDNSLRSDYEATLNATHLRKSPPVAPISPILGTGSPSSATDVSQDASKKDVIDRIDPTETPPDGVLV